VNRLYKIIFSYLIAILIFSVLILFLLNNKEQLKKISEISPWYILEISGLVILYRLISAFSIKRLIKAFGVDMSFKEWFGLSSVTTMANYFMPLKSGMLTRAFYLKNKYNFAYSQFLAAALGFCVFFFFINVVVGLISISLIFLLSGTFYFKLFIFLCAAFFCIGIFILSWEHFSKKELRFELLNKLFLGLAYFKKQKRLLISLLGLNMLGTLIMALRFFVAFKAIGVSADFLAMVTLANIVSLSFIINITPADLGIREAAITIMTGLIGLSTLDGALVSVIDRSISFILAFLFGGIFSISLFRGINFFKNMPKR